jgi:hypothetical protein
MACRQTLGRLSLRTKEGIAVDIGDFAAGFGYHAFLFSYTC